MGRGGEDGIGQITEASDPVELVIEKVPDGFYKTRNNNSHDMHSRCQGVQPEGIITQGDASTN